MIEGIIPSDEEAVIKPRLLVKPGSWLAKIDVINHLILFNNALITILSEKNGGKTSFGSLLQTNLDQQIKSVSIKVNSFCTRERIIKNIATQLPIKFDDNSDLSSIVAQVNENKLHVLLILDDAQNLSLPLIKEVLLAIKNQDNFKFFHLCFLADYSIVAKLNELTALYFDNLVQTIELGSLNESETRTYVLQRAMTAHLITRPLTDLQLKHFYQLTKGSVAKINSNLESFVSKCAMQKKKNPLSMIKNVVYAASILLFSGCIGFYFSQSYQHNFDAHVETVSVPMLNEEIATKVLTESVKQPEILKSYIASWQDSSTRQLVYSSLPLKQNLDDPDTENSMPIQAIVDKVVVIPKLEPLISSKNVSSPNLIPESKLVKIEQLSKRKRNHLTLAKKHSNHYTIQVAASHNKKDIERFKLSSQLLASKAKVRHVTNAKGVWYVLTVGDFENRLTAQQSIGKFPTSLTKLNPWVRPISNLG